jgi:hypothetical protein
MPLIISECVSAGENPYVSLIEENDTGGLTLYRLIHPTTLVAALGILSRVAGSLRDSATLFLTESTYLSADGLAYVWSPPAVADRLSPAKRTARASEPVTPAACSSPVRRFRPLSPVSSVTWAVPLLLP